MPADGIQPPDNGEEQKNNAEPGQRKARALVWLVAGCCLLVGALNLGLYLVQAHKAQQTVSWVRCLWLSIPLVIGGWLLVKTAALADWINDWLDQ